MSAKKPNTVLAPLVIAGITIGFLGAAYKFIFIDSKSPKKEQNENLVNSKAENDDEKRDE